MPKCVPIGSYGQNQALRGHVWAENGPRTAETRPDSVDRDRIRIITRPSYVLIYAYARVHARAIEDFFLNLAVSVLLLLASLRDCSQNQIAVHLTHYARYLTSNTTMVIQQH